MRYISTRGESPELSFLEAVETGLAPDGGLYLPENLPDIGPFLPEWEGCDYAALTTAFFRLFATDMEEADLQNCVERSLCNFSHPEIAPLKWLGEDLALLELFHGPTLAFKDFALQLLGNLYEAQILRSGKPITVLGATSGDTGAAAIHGLLGKEGVEIFILYPKGGVSALQERQMACTGAGNVHAVAIDGTFDDAQAAIKELFGDLQFREQLRLSAVNSINLARVLAQCVYYIWAWLRLPAKQREAVRFVVPTGNFGNVLAGWLAKEMGLPVAEFQVATNQNDILYRLFTTGVYEASPVLPSHAPSMDIQVASNFERFLYYHEGRDVARVRKCMADIRSSGKCIFREFRKDIFSSARADDALIRKRIHEVYRDFGTIIDPHTACGFADLPKGGMRIVLSTAHAAKFPEVVQGATGVLPTAAELEALKDLPLRRAEIDGSAQSVRAFLIQHLKGGCP